MFTRRDDMTNAGQRLIASAKSMRAQLFMTDIPEDVMKTAEAVWDEFANGINTRPEEVGMIARALMAERERCYLAVADSPTGDGPDTDEYNQGYVDARNHALAAIRKRLVVLAPPSPDK